MKGFKKTNFRCLRIVYYIEKGVEVFINAKELQVLMIQNTDFLIRLAYYYVKDLQVAEDIVQEVFIKSFNKQSNYVERGELKAFLTKMTVNKSKDYLKSWTYRNIQLQNNFFSPVGKENVDELVRNDVKAIIGEAILKLPLKQREVLIHFYFNELAILEIAHILSIPESTVKTRLSRGRELLRNQLNGIEWEALLYE